MLKTQKHPKHTFMKGDVYYFSRAVPCDLQDLYAKPRIVQSLKTKSVVHARRSASLLSAKLDDYWLGLRLKRVDVPAKHLLIQAAQQNAVFAVGSELSPTLSEALGLYVSLKGADRGDSFRRMAERNIGYVIDVLGDRPLDSYNTADAATLRQYLLNKGLKRATLIRIFGGIKAVANFAINEHGLPIKNPFAGVYLPGTGSEKTRRPIPTQQVQKIQEACRHIDDDIRWLVALVADTGMRLSEAAGLTIDDLTLDHPLPHIVVRPHDHRRLKTAASERLIPLVGSALWAARRIESSVQGDYCFPRYASGNGCNSNSASAAINKWIKTIAGDEAVIHGLRHSFRDRLRSIEAPLEVTDQLGGWSAGSVGQRYGSGYELDVLTNWMRKIVLQDDSGPTG
jgi:integrase